jgi:DNA-binding CsgD family transcriptional regulator
MERLSARDLRLLLEQTRQLHESPSLETFPVRALACVRALVGADYAAYEELDPVRRRTVGLTDPPEARPEPASIAVWEAHMHQHPVIRRLAETNDRRAMAISDLMSAADYRRTGLYGEFYRHWGVEDQLGLFVAAPKPTMVGIGLQRDRRTFTARDRRVLDAAQPHLAVAYANAVAMSRLADAAAGAAAGANGDGHGPDGRGNGHAAGEGHALLAVPAVPVPSTRPVTIDVGGDGRARAMSAPAHAWLDAYFPGGRPRRCGDLPDAVRRWLGRSRALASPASLVDADAAAARPPPPLRVRSARGRLTLRLIPRAGGRGTLIVLEEEPAPPPPASPAARRALLAPRLRPVLDGLLAGRSEKEVAAACELSPHTVHEYVKAIYRRMGVNSRAELLALWVAA